MDVMAAAGLVCIHRQRQVAFDVPVAGMDFKIGGNAACHVQKDLSIGTSNIGGGCQLASVCEGDVQGPVRAVRLHTGEAAFRLDASIGGAGFEGSCGIVNLHASVARDKFQIATEVADINRAITGMEAEIALKTIGAHRAIGGVCIQVQPGRYFYRDPRGVPGVDVHPPDRFFLELKADEIAGLAFCEVVTRRVAVVPLHIDANLLAVPTGVDLGRVIADLQMEGGIAA